MNVTFTLKNTSSGTAAGPFNISGTTDANVVSSLATGITKNQLSTGHTINSVNDAITGGTIASTGTCTTSIPWVASTTPLGVLMDNHFILGVTEAATCPSTGIPFVVYISQSDYDNRYLQGGAKFITLYTNEELTIPYTGYTYVYFVNLSEVEQLNTSTGVVGNPSSYACL